MNKIITIGREFGSGGREIGRRLSDALGIAYYDQEVIVEIAKRTKLSEQYVHQIMEHRPVTPFPIHFGCSFYNLPNPAWDQNMAIYKEQRDIILEMAQKSDCVIVGRCADYILREHKDLLRVFIYAPMEERIRRSVEEYGDKESNMEAFVARKDKQRASYYNYFTSVRWGDRKSYDLCINSALGLDTAVELIRTAALAREGQSK